MKRNSLIFAAFFVIVSCDRPDDINPQDPSQSFMPLQIGNYWKGNPGNYIEVKDTIRVNGELFYKISGVVGSDALTTEYLRLTENQELIETSLKDPSYRYTKANFNLKVGQSFQTLGNQTVNDYKVTVVEKTNTKMTFSWDMIYHQNFKGHPFNVTYLRGVGPYDGWLTAKINGKILTAP